MPSKNLDIGIHHLHAHTHTRLTRKKLPSKPSFVFDFDSTRSSDKDDFSSLISAININHPPSHYSSSKFTNHLKEDPPYALSAPAKSSPTLKTHSNRLPSISSSNSKKTSGPNKTFDFSSH